MSDNSDNIKMDFSSSVYNKADYSAIKSHFMANFNLIGRYPQHEAQVLEKIIAKKLDVPEKAVMVTNGANEAIYLIAQLYKGWASIIPQPTYNVYEEACRIFDHVISYEDNVDLDYLPEDRIYWLCNPNNPTGNVLLKSLVNHIIRNNPRYLYVVDQSFADYTLCQMLEPKEMMDCYNVMLIFSFSKTYCIPGLHLGYVVGSPVIIDRLKFLRQPWSINMMAIETVKYCIEHNVQLLPDLETFLSEAKRLHDGLSAIEGVMVMKTDTNFMLVHTDKGNVHELKQWLIDHYGILIYDASNFRGLDQQYFRVSVQSPEENDALIEALEAYQKWKMS